MHSFLLNTVVAALAATASAGHLGRRMGARSTHVHSARQDARVLQPISGLNLDSSGNLAVRDDATPSGFKPGDFAQMLFGAIEDNGAVHLANMTLYAPSGLPIVMMEAFEHMTTDVDCEGHDGEMSLTFKNKEVFDNAIGQWTYINEDTDKNFLLIANHDGCGPEGERQAYTITDVDNDEEKNIVYLTSKPAAWKEVAGSFDLDFGVAKLPPGAAKSARKRGISSVLRGMVNDKISGGNRRRGIGDFFNDIKDGFNDVVDDVKDGGKDVIDDIKDGGKDVIDDIKEGGEDVVDDIKEGGESIKDGILDLGDGDLSESFNIPLNIGEEKKEQLLFEDFTKLPPRLVLTCTDCWVRGSLKTTGTLKVNDFKPEALSLEVSPEDFRATIELQAVIAQTAPSFDFLKFEQTIFEAPIPGAGIVVPGILTVGVTGKFDVSGSVGVFGIATTTFGGKTQIPNGGKLKVDLIDFEKSSATGFDNIDSERILDLDDATITMNAAAGPQLGITIGVDVLDKFGAEAAMNFGVPRFNFNVTTGYDEDGWCGEDDNVTSGVKSVSAVNFDMMLNIQAKGGTHKIQVFERKLVNIPLATFLDECMSVPDITPPKIDAPEEEKPEEEKPKEEEDAPQEEEPKAARLKPTEIQPKQEGPPPSFVVSS